MLIQGHQHESGYRFWGIVNDVEMWIAPGDWEEFQSLQNFQIKIGEGGVVLNHEEHEANKAAQRLFFKNKVVPSSKLPKPGAMAAAAAVEEAAVKTATTNTFTKSLEFFGKNKVILSAGVVGIVGISALMQKHHPDRDPLKRGGQVRRNPESPVRDVLSSMFLSGITVGALRGLSNAGVSIPKSLRGAPGFYGFFAAFAGASRSMHLQDPGVAITTAAAATLLNYGSYHFYKRMVPVASSKVASYLDSLAIHEVETLRENTRRVMVSNPKLASFLKRGAPFALAAASIPIGFSFVEKHLRKWHNRGKTTAAMQTSTLDAGQRKDAEEPSFIPIRRVADELRVSGFVESTHDQSRIRDAMRF